MKSSQKKSGQKKKKPQIVIKPRKMVIEKKTKPPAIPQPGTGYAELRDEAIKIPRQQRVDGLPEVVKNYMSEPLKPFAKPPPSPMLETMPEPMRVPVRAPMRAPVRASWNEPRPMSLPRTDEFTSEKTYGGWMGNTPRTTIDNTQPRNCRTSSSTVYSNANSRDSSAGRPHRKRDPFGKLMSARFVTGMANYFDDSAAQDSNDAASTTSSSSSVCIIGEVRPNGEKSTEGGSSSRSG